MLSGFINLFRPTSIQDQIRERKKEAPLENVLALQKQESPSTTFSMLSVMSSIFTSPLDQLKVRRVQVPLDNVHALQKQELTNNPPPSLSGYLSIAREICPAKPRYVHEKLHNSDFVMGALIWGMFDPKLFWWVERWFKLEAAKTTLSPTKYQTSLTCPRQFFESIIRPNIPTPIVYTHSLLHRPGKFAGEPILKRKLKESWLGHFLMDTLGHRAGEIALHGVSGFLIGLSVETLLMPIEIKKTEEILHGRTCDYPQQMRGVLDKLVSGTAYRGGVSAALGYSLGCAGQFASAAAVFHIGLGYKDRRDASTMESLFAAGLGSALYVIVTHPFIVVNVHMVKPEFANMSTSQVVVKLADEAGAGKFFAGLPARLIAAGPRGAFGMFCTGVFANYIHDTVEGKGKVVVVDDCEEGVKSQSKPKM